LENNAYFCGKENKALLMAEWRKENKALLMAEWRKEK